MKGVFNKECVHQDYLWLVNPKNAVKSKYESQMLNILNGSQDWLNELLRSMFDPRGTFSDKKANCFQKLKNINF